MWPRNFSLMLRGSVLTLVFRFLTLARTPASGKEELAQHREPHLPLHFSALLRALASLSLRAAAWLKTLARLPAVAWG